MFEDAPELRRSIWKEAIGLYSPEEEDREVGSQCEVAAAAAAAEWQSPAGAPVAYSGAWGHFTVSTLGLREARQLSPGQGH